MYPFFMKIFGEPANIFKFDNDQVLFFSYENKNLSIRPCKSRFSDSWGIEVIFYYGTLNRDIPKITDEAIEELIKSVEKVYESFGVDKEDIKSSIDVWNITEQEPVHFELDEDEYMEWVKSSIPMV